MSIQKCVCVHFRVKKLNFNELMQNAFVKETIQLFFFRFLVNEFN